ncbi:MAG: ASKHA domain-containing protein [Candidatus Aminicenantales bacterium]
MAVNPPVKKYLLPITKPPVNSPLSVLNLILNQFQKTRLFLSLEALKELIGLIEKKGRQTTAVIYNDEECLSFESSRSVDQNFGIAIDVGTTTLAMELVNLNNGETVDVSTAMNSQVKYGADVLSRITAAFQDAKKIEELKRSVLDSLNRMIQKLLHDNRIRPDFVYEIVVAGNTAMNHLLLGLSPSTLAVSPYQAVFSELPPLPASDLGFMVNRRAKVYIVPNIKSFIGGDIAAGLAASALEDFQGNDLFVDLGTNGEIVLKKGKEFMALSTAAGPAFEGMNISCGMPAFPGAIYKAEYGKTLKTMTVGDQPAKGICGTGLIDLMAVFMEKGLLSSKGKIRAKTNRLPVARKIFISQKDVREMQLAVAAVKTGIQMLLDKKRLRPGRLDRIWIAGAFGNYLNIQNSMKIGLLPRVGEKKIRLIGNASLAGAKALLVSKEERERCRRLVRRIKHFSLAASPQFQQTFIRSLEFKAWP